MTRLFIKGIAGLQRNRFGLGLEMLFENVAIIDLAHVEPTQRVHSSEFETQIAGTLERLGLPPNMLQALAGIEERRWGGADVQPSDIAAEAAEKVLARSGIPRSSIGCLINTSVCRDYIEPSTAAIVHGKLGLSGHCLNFDLGNACLAFMNAMEVAGQMIERGAIEYALVVDGENSQYVQTKTLERLAQADVSMEQFRQEFATLTLGSGGVAMLLGAKDKVEQTHTFRGGVSIAATEWSGLCRGQVDYMETDTRILLAEGVKLAHRTFQLACDVLSWSPTELDELVLHQVSAVHTRKLCEALGLDPSRGLLTFPQFGNIGPASVPFTLAKAVSEGRVKAGDRIGLLGIGSGLNCAMAEIVW